MYEANAVDILRKAIEPNVITKSMLVSLAIEQGPKNEAGKLYVQDGIELNNLQGIRIEFLNILHIDHLWLLTNLVKLSLSHNVIEKIENIDELVHLRELDLSFNRIKTIENLENLNQLEILVLYSNEISIIENLNNFKKLTILNIGKNKIADWNHVLYLRDFKALKSLNTCDNPCTQMEGYLDYLFAFIPQLLYYQYKMISDSARQSAINKHYRTISNIEEKEEKEAEQFTLQQEFEERTALLSISYVEYLDQDYLFQQMFSSDEEGKILTTINEDTENAFKEYRKFFSAICQELYELGLQEHKKRTEEIELYEIAVNDGKEKTQNETRRIVDEVLEKKMEIFANIKNVTKALIDIMEPDTTDDYVMKAKELFNEFNDLLSKARMKLMSKEVTLHDQMEDINDIFKINMTDMVSTFMENARGYFSQLRNAESEYNDTINGLVLYYLSGFGDDAKIPAHFSKLCGDKDTLTNTLATSHDMHSQVIDDREDCMINRLDNWLKEYTNQLILDENQRNRRQILEISHFYAFQQQEFNSLGLPQLDLPDIDLDDLTSLEN